CGTDSGSARGTSPRPAGTAQRRAHHSGAPHSRSYRIARGANPHGVDTRRIPAAAAHSRPAQRGGARRVQLWRRGDRGFDGSGRRARRRTSRRRAHPAAQGTGGGAETQGPPEGSSKQERKPVMMITRRHFLGAAAGGTALASGFGGSALAAWEPQSPIQIVVGFAAGGGTDVVARAITTAGHEF